VWSRGLPSDPTSVRVYRDSLGHWYASFVVRCDDEPLPDADAPVDADGRAHGAIAVEDFKPRFLTKSTMARKAQDAAIGATKRELIDYAQRVGRKVVLVPPAYTTMTCADCGARAKQRLELSEREFVCYACGLVSDRDRNAARVVLARAGFLPADADAVRHLVPPFEVASDAG
jgi:transposase